MRNIKLVLEYDGTRFFGWQAQPNARTVQVELERSLALLTRESIRVLCAGRTDTGVHAYGQVVNFFITTNLPLKAFVNGTNALLPPDIRVLSAQEAPPEFHARFSAKSRSYRYVIRDHPSALQRLYSWYVSQPLDIEAMQQASNLILGEHDFKSFCHAEPDNPHFLCFVLQAVWKNVNDLLYFDIRANRFLHHMVRVLVATFVEIGKGRMNLVEFQAVCEAHDRGKAGPTAPAHGLFLMHVDYD
jgi:tRNA pseudouridine38-40 synthase